MSDGSVFGALCKSFPTHDFGSYEVFVENNKSFTTFFPQKKRPDCMDLELLEDGGVLLSIGDRIHRKRILLRPVSSLFDRPHVVAIYSLMCVKWSKHRVGSLMDFAFRNHRILRQADAELEHIKGTIQSATAVAIHDTGLLTIKHTRHENEATVVSEINVNMK